MKRLWLAAILFTACATDVDQSAMTFDDLGSDNLEFSPADEPEEMTCNADLCEPAGELRPLAVPECERNDECAAHETCHGQRCVPVLQPSGR